MPALNARHHFFVLYLIYNEVDSQYEWTYQVIFSDFLFIGHFLETPNGLMDSQLMA